MTHHHDELAEGAFGVQAPRAQMHLVVIGGLDPAATDTWSGAPRAIVDALRQQGHRVSTIGPLQRLETGWPRLKAWWHRRINGKAYLAVRDPSIVQRRLAALQASLRKLEPYDAVIAWHAADAAIVRARAPTIFVHDATWRRLLDFYPRYERRRLTASTIAQGEALDRIAIENCTRVIYSSHWAADSARTDYGTPASKIVVQSFGANLSPIPTDEALRPWVAERGRGACRLLFVGLDWRRKGGDVAIAVAHQLNERGLTCELDVAGAQPPAGPDRYVRWHGLLSQRNPVAMRRLATLFARADFLILPTRADCTPIVLNEAAAFGLPSATTAVGGIPELVGDSGWARAFPVNAPAEAFADWIECCYRDRGRYHQMVWLARSEYARRLNWATFARALTDVIAQLRPRTAAAREVIESTP